MPRQSEFVLGKVFKVSGKVIRDIGKVLDVEGEVLEEAGKFLEVAREVFPNHYE